jgi:hypothetical protein
MTGTPDRSSSSSSVDHGDPRRMPAPFTVNGGGQQQPLQQPSGAVGVGTNLFSGADPSFIRSNANAGGRGGEAHARRDRQMELGPSQVPSHRSTVLVLSRFRRHVSPIVRTDAINLTRKNRSGP